MIDWTNAEDGPPGLGWAMSALILAQFAVSGDPASAKGAAVLDARAGNLAVAGRLIPCKT